MGDFWPQELPIPAIHASHSWNEYGVLFRIIEEYDVTDFIELGIFKGGLASLMVLRAYIQPGFFYLGIELNEHFIDPRLRRLASYAHRAEIMQGDVFGSRIQERVKERRLGKKLVYCDNGNKPRELAEYTKILRPKDLIAAHDHGTEINEGDYEGLLWSRMLQWANVDGIGDTRIALFERLK